MERGYELSITYGKDVITDTDAYGDSVIDGVFRGGNCFLQGTSKEYKAGILNAVTPYAALAPTGASYLGPGVIGRADSDIAGILIMTATTGSLAASAPATLTATYAIIAENFDVRMFMGPEHRKCPFRFRFLLYSDAGTMKWFTTT